MDYIYEYYEETVKPTVEEFLKDKTDLRKGRLAAIVLDHMRDYRIVQQGIGTTEILLNEIKHDCFDLVLIRDVCNASKHCILTSNCRNKTNVKNPRNLTKVSDIKSEKNTGTFRAPFGTPKALFGEANRVYMKFDEPIIFNNEKIIGRFLHEAISEVIQYWNKILYSA